MLLGLLVILPTGNLAACDPTGVIALDLSQATSIPEDSAWFCPGMIVLVDGVYEEEEESVGKGLSGSSGIGGTIGGKFQGFFIGQPPCEKRKVTLGVSGPDGGHDHTIGGGFGWIDFLGVGSERAAGPRMRKLEQRLLRQPSSPDAPGRGRIVILGELHLDEPRTLQAVRKILETYAREPEGTSPLSFVMMGNFTEHAVMSQGGSGGSIEYKEYFDSLASVLTDFPTLLQTATFAFVPGDNDGWVSAFSGGASAPLPRKAVPDMFTSRIRRAFATANAEANIPTEDGGQPVFTTNPSRLTLFGPSHELVLFRDDISARLRRTGVRVGSARKKPQRRGDGEATADNGAEAMDVDDPAADNTPGDAAQPVAEDVRTARKLVKTILDQGYLAPFRQPIRPVHWDYAGAMHLYPLPTAMALVDTTAPPFCVTYEGCHVMNPGSILVTGRRGVGRWIEYHLGGSGKVRECLF